MDGPQAVESSAIDAAYLGPDPIVHLGGCILDMERLKEVASIVPVENLSTPAQVIDACIKICQSRIDKMRGQ